MTTDSDSPSPLFSLQLLGGWQLQTATGKNIWLRRKARALLAYLAVAPPQRREALAALFCGTAAAPNRTLNVLFSRIRKATAVTALHTTSDGRLTLHHDLFDVDYLQFHRILRGDLSALATGELETALSHYQGDFLTGLTLAESPEFELWLLGERARAAGLWEKGVLTLLPRLRETGAYDRAITHARRLLQHNPLLEEAHAELIWLYARTGQMAAAQQQYVHGRALLQAELGVAPGPALQRIWADLQSGELHPRPGGPVSPVSPAAGLSDFIGRAAELTRLRALWRAAQSGQGGTVLVHAPAGGGKSRFIAELLRDLPPHTVYRAGCYESSQMVPYQPWLPILEAHLHRLDDAALQGLPPATLAYVARLLPQLTTRCSPVHPLPQVVAEPERLFAALLDFLQAGEVTPTIFFIDDLQWADAASLRLFHFVSLRAAKRPWLLLAAYRREERGAAPALETLLADCARRDIPQFALTPLTAQEILALIERNWPQLAGENRRSVAAQLLARTGGNPLFVTALLAELAAGTELPDALPIPPSVQELVQSRLRRLSAGGRQVWEGLAVLGEAADLTQLQAISGRSIPEVEEGLEWGLQWGMVRAETAVTPTRYLFDHDLLREAVYATLSVVRRQRLHRRTAIFLDQSARRRPLSVRQERINAILYHAQQGDLPRLLFDWSRDAADAARHMFAYPELLQAVDSMRAAYTRLQTAPDFVPETDEPALFEQLLWWLTYSWAVGRTAEEEAAVLALVEELLARHATPLRERQAQLVKLQMQTDFAALIPQLEQLYLDFMRLEEGQLAAAALIQGATAAITVSRNREGQALYARAQALYRQMGDQTGEVRALSGMVWAALNLGAIETAVQHGERALTLSREQGDKLGEAAALFSLAAAVNFYHHAASVRAPAEQAAALYAEIGFHGRTIRPTLYLGAAQLLEGELAAALATFERVLAAAQQQEDGWVGGWAAQLAGRIYLQRGELGMAAERLQLAQKGRLASGERQNQISDGAWLGRLALQQGDPAAADLHTVRAIELLEIFQGEFFVWEQPDVWMARAEVLTALGDSAAARECVARAAATLHRFAAQISHPQHKAAYVAYPPNGRILRAAAGGKILPWPQG